MDNFEPVPGVKLNGKLTLGENTADNGGLRLAYMALMNTLAKQTRIAQDRRLHAGAALLYCASASLCCETGASSRRGTACWSIRIRRANGG